MKKLPKQINVAWANLVGENGEPFLIARETDVSLVEVGSTREIGIYQLVETITMRGKVEIARSKKRRVA